MYERLEDHKGGNANEWRCLRLQSKLWKPRHIEVLRRERDEGKEMRGGWVGWGTVFLVH